jgi:hypothetical protein
MPFLDIYLGTPPGLFGIWLATQNSLGTSEHPHPKRSRARNLLQTGSTFAAAIKCPDLKARTGVPVHRGYDTLRPSSSAKVAEQDQKNQCRSRIT